MLIWINGAFGAGKTQVAYELRRRLPSAHVADPEHLGFALHRMLPPAQRTDFQDLPQWRAAVLTTLQRLEATHNGPVIVPMTIVRDEYFDEIVGGLRTRGVEVRHFTLVVTPQVLRERLRLRSAYIVGRLLGRNETWAMQQIDRCVAALVASRYERHVPADNATVDEIVESIADDAGINLRVPRLSPPRYQLRRLSVGVRHIRF